MFHVVPPREGGTEVCINGPGHMVKMATTPIYDKTLQNSSYPEPKVLYILGTWHAASETQALQGLYK